MSAKRVAKTYREMSAELDEILADLQQGDLDIEDAIKRYQRGMELVDAMEGYLKNAETKITELKARFTEDPEG
ncbi:MAG TPA: exodeoxyribonuclease VII small subunit [Candidatus Saccharimonadales bacterium]|nr:exodeoxyribonuclease VII small subunit [Candidatus Saccharimonadales bacterium]